MPEAPEPDTLYVCIMWFWMDVPTRSRHQVILKGCNLAIKLITLGDRPLEAWMDSDVGNGKVVTFPFPEPNSEWLTKVLGPGNPGPFRMRCIYPFHEFV